MRKLFVAYNNIFWIVLLHLCATSFFIVGLTAPVISIKKKIFIFTLENDTWSILGGIYEMLTNDHLLIGILIILFTIIFPITKLSVLIMVLVKSISVVNTQRLMKILTLSSKWSMLDVFIIAVMIVIAKMSNYADATARWGIYVFATHVIISMALVNMVQDYLEANNN